MSDLVDDEFANADDRDAEDQLEEAMNNNDYSFGSLHEAEDFEIESQRILGGAGIDITESSHDGLTTLIDKYDEAKHKIAELNAAVFAAQAFNDHLRSHVALYEPHYTESFVLKSLLEKALAKHG